MTKEACNFMDGFILGRYPNKIILYKVEMTTKKTVKNKLKHNLYTLIIVDRTILKDAHIIEKSDETESTFGLNSMGTWSMEKLIKTLKPV